MPPCHTARPNSLAVFQRRERRGGGLFHSRIGVVGSRFSQSIKAAVKSNLADPFGREAPKLRICLDLEQGAKLRRGVARLLEFVKRLLGHLPGRRVFAGQEEAQKQNRLPRIINGEELIDAQDSRTS